MIAARLALAGALLCFAPAAAQAQAAEEEVPILRLGRSVVVPQGTRIPLRTLEKLSSKTARQGQRVALEVPSDVVFDDSVVIRAGTPAVGEISRVIAKGVFGKSGKLGLRVMFLEIGGHRVRLDGEARDKGTPGTAPVLVGAALIGVYGTFFTGTSAVMPAGSPIDGFLHEDLGLTILESQ